MFIVALFIFDDVEPRCPHKEKVPFFHKVNKEAMKALIQDLGKPGLQINADLAIEEAFKILNSGAKSNRTTSNCNKAIMLISDGVEGEDVAPSVFEKYSPNRTVRIIYSQI